MDTSASATALTAKLVTALVMLTGVVLAIFFGIKVSEGRTMVPYMVMAPIIGGTIGLLMGRNYWLLIPFGFVANLPAFPLLGRSFELPEICLMGATALFTARLCMKHEKLDLWHITNTGVFLYAAWCFWCFYQNPVGLSALGASSGGARFYFKIFLALAGFVVITNQTISEKQAKWIVWSIVLGAFVGLVYEILRWRVFGIRTITGTFIGGGSYTWHQKLSTVGYAIILYYVCRYRMDQIFSFKRPWIVPVMALAGATGLMGGKRAAMAAAAFLPVMASILRRQFAYTLLFFGGGAALVGFLVVGHGNFFELPFGVQRSLANLPGEWDKEVYDQTRGDFRRELRDLALIEIKKDPLYGRKGFDVNFKELHKNIGFVGEASDINYREIVNHALSSNWHNTWLGVSADFGIPAAVFWAIFCVSAVIVGFHAYKRYPEGDWRFILGMMVYLSLMTTILRTWTSGHSAFNQWWMYAILLVLLRQKIEPQVQKVVNPAATSKRKVQHSAKLTETAGV